MNKVELLDCTLRDGGYINNWNFGEKNIHLIIQHLSDSGIDIIECGFLTKKTPNTIDHTLFSDIKEFDRFVPSKKTSQYVCMINFGDYDLSDLPLAFESSIDGIRLAFHKKDSTDAIKAGRTIIKLGYDLYLQPMVTVSYSDKELLSLIQETNLLNAKACYIVDSFGVMKRSDLLRIFFLFDHNLARHIKIGYHSHNNLQLAYSNAQAMTEVHSAREIIIDSSVFGMGRGAGNLNTELFVEYLNENKECNYEVFYLLKIIDDVLNRIYHKNYWGYSLPHYLSAICNCHPNYATFLAEKNTLTVKGVHNVLSLISNQKSINFNQNYAEDLYLQYQAHNVDDRQDFLALKKIVQGKNIVLIAPGGSINKELSKIKVFFTKKDSLTISINFLSDLLDVDYAFFSNAKRFNCLEEGPSFIQSQHKLIITSNISPQDLNNLKVINYTNLINESNIVKDNSILMFLKLLIKLEVKQVSIAGMDGYSYIETGNYINKELEYDFDKYQIDTLNNEITKELKLLSKRLKINFITPSKYSLKTK